MAEGSSAACADLTLPEPGRERPQHRGQHHTDDRLARMLMPLPRGLPVAPRHRVGWDDFPKTTFGGLTLVMWSVSASRPMASRPWK